MHQTFYIDIDEEITSIVEKLRKTEAPEAVLVVPKRALLIQSIVNLKLLRKEADSLGLKISIVTQDKLGKMLIEKAGIFIQQKVEDSYEETERVDARYANEPKRELKKGIETDALAGGDGQSKRRLEKIGSADYFISDNGTDGYADREKDWQELEKIKEEKPVLMNDFVKENKVAVSAGINPEDNLARKRNVPAMDVSVPARNATPARNGVATSGEHSVADGPARNVASGVGASAPRGFFTNNAPDGLSRQMPKQMAPAISDPGNNFPEIPYSKTRPNYLKNSLSEYGTEKKENSRDQQLENFFYANNLSNKNKDGYADKKEDSNGGSTNKFFKGLAILGAIVLAGGLIYVGYLYVPKAKITVFAKKEVKSVDTTITGNVSYDSLDYEKLTIPAKLMEFDEEVAKTFDATGKKNVSNKKAKGKITIYNEFSSSPQPLVATTRFLSENQKIFRLVQGVTVPGTTKVGEEIKPGVVEAEVIADEAGDGFNIEATSFTIPGFKNSGNDKYAKIYAKSLATMSGGGNGNEEIGVITDKDISGAKDKISLEISSAVKKKIKDSAEVGTVILDDSIVIDEPVYRLSNSEGETADNFEIKVGAHARALVFLESDMKKIANAVISKSGSGKINIDSGSVIIDYGKSSVDIKLGTIEIKMHASNVAQPNLDLVNLKKGLLGKSNEELADYLKTYPSIERAEVEYFPQLFISKIPMNEKRVEIVLEATMP